MRFITSKLHGKIVMACSLVLLVVVYVSYKKSAGFSEFPWPLNFPQFCELATQELSPKAMRKICHEPAIVGNKKRLKYTYHIPKQSSPLQSGQMHACLITHHSVLSTCAMNEEGPSSQILHSTTVPETQQSLPFVGQIFQSLFALSSLIHVSLYCT